MGILYISISFYLPTMFEFAATIEFTNPLQIIKMVDPCL